MTTKAASFGIAAMFAMLLSASAGAAQPDRGAGTETPGAVQSQAAGEKLGEVHFPISCNSDAQKRFDRAVAILHSMWYEEAVKAFTGVAEADPACAMAWWGVAMSHWYPLWYPPPPAALKAGAAAVAKAEAVGAKSERERGYIAAIATFYLTANPCPRHPRPRLRARDGEPPSALPRGPGGGHLLRACAECDRAPHRQDLRQSEESGGDTRADLRRATKPSRRGALPHSQRRRAAARRGRPASGTPLRRDRALGAACSAHAVAHLHSARLVAEINRREPPFGCGGSGVR